MCGSARISIFILLVQTALSAAPVNAQIPYAPLFAEKWIDGTQPQEPEAQVQALDRDTFVIRQSLKTNFEAPFVYLLFGHDKVLLVDTGAEGGRLRPVVDRIVQDWLTANRRPEIPLIVAHSHSHGDHVAGDAAFRERPNTVVVGLRPGNVSVFFGIENWPQEIGRFDLGGRVLSVIPTPGHEPASIMIYDPRLEILLSGDVLYPGRLYVPVNFMTDERASIDRLAAFAATNAIRAVLGAHIEMTRRPGQDYAREATVHQDEHRLELTARSIGELQTGLKASLDVPERPQVHDDFIIYPLAPPVE